MATEIISTHTSLLLQNPSHIFWQPSLQLWHWGRHPQLCHLIPWLTAISTVATLSQAQIGKWPTSLPHRENILQWVILLGISRSSPLYLHWRVLLSPYTSKLSTLVSSSNLSRPLVHNCISVFSHVHKETSFHVINTHWHGIHNCLVLEHNRVNYRTHHEKCHI